jgi:hypothetical protein
MPGVDRHTAVAFFDGVVVIGMITRGEKMPVDQLMVLCLGLLDANDISILPVHPVKKAFVGSSPDAVGIECNDSHPCRAPEKVSSTTRQHSKTPGAFGTQFLFLPAFLAY